MWLFHHNIELEREHENVKIGKQIHEDRYPRVKKEVNIRDKMKPVLHIRFYGLLYRHHSSSSTYLFTISMILFTFFLHLTASDLLKYSV
ncbi:MAG: Dna2/Cas4 domain-containing protein [Candidatus Thermoplasmatota archaeon]